MSERISRDQLAEAIKKGGVKLFDVRRRAAYDLSHIPGAVHVSDGLPADLTPIPNTVVVVYSYGLDDDRATMIAARLEVAGFDRVFLYAEGFRDWVSGRMQCEPLIKTYACTVCSFGYYPHMGFPKAGIPPGTLFEELPNNWRCPWCGAPKSKFETQQP